jgi:Uri superfamily endonuclease
VQLGSAVEGGFMPKGSYILVLQLEQAVDDLPIGKLGRFNFPAGYYLYVGSAFGPGGLEARLRHHERRTKNRPHWHIDYLRAHANLYEIWVVSSESRLERQWCAALAAVPDLSTPAPGFGASDTGCCSHLFYLLRPPHPNFLGQIILADLLTNGPAEVAIEVHRYETSA